MEIIKIGGAGQSASIVDLSDLKSELVSLTKKLPFNR